MAQRDVNEKKFHAETDLAATNLYNSGRALLENANTSPRAKRLASFTGLIGQDIDVFCRFTAIHRLLIIARMPDFHASSYAQDLKNGTRVPKRAFEHGKSDALALTEQGSVSDVDLMCLHRRNDSTGEYSAIISDWDGKRRMTGEEAKYIGGLNQLLISKIQHGCNDNYVNFKKALNPVIGYDFIAFNCGIPQVFTFVQLKSYYHANKLKNWHAEYCESIRPPSKSDGTS
jgi:hypothetical protein